MSRASSSDLPRGEPILLLAVVVLILYFARELLIPLAFALTLSFLLAPAVTRLEKLRAPRVLAVTLTGVLAFSCIFGVGYVVARQLMSIARDLPTYRLSIQKRIALVHSPAEQSLEKALAAAEGIGEDLSSGGRSQPAQSSSILLQLPPEQAQPVRLVDPNRSQLQSNAEFLLRILRPIGTIGVVIVFTIYLLMKREDLRHRILLLAGMGRISLMTQALQDAASRISQYLVMQALVNASYGILFGSGLFLIGVPDATLWGALAGILRVIPYVGTATGLVLPLVLSIAVFSSWWYPVLIVALFLLLELSVTNFVEPWLYSSRTGISSLALLTMAIFWTLVWGWPGLILSTPLTVCIVVLGRYVPQMSFLHTLLGTDAELSAEAHFYERLLAMDQREARAIASRFLNGKPLVDLYDAILIPALRLVEQDRHQGTLDDARCNFFFLSIGELIAELTDYREVDRNALSEDSNALIPPDPASVPGATDLAGGGAAATSTWAVVQNPGSLPDIYANGNLPEAGQKLDRPAQPQRPENEFAIICISASDQADELTSLMLAQLMERAGHPTLMLPASSISPEVLDGLARETNTVVFISALPPFAFSQARSICQRIRTHLPHNRIVIGYWILPDDPDQLPDEMIERFGSGRPTLVVNTLVQALQQITQWQQQTKPERQAVTSQA